MDHTKAICQPYISVRTSYHCFEALTKSYSSYWEILCPPQFSNYLLQNMKDFHWDNFILPFAKSSYKVAGSPGEECAIFNPTEFSQMWHPTYQVSALSSHISFVGFGQDSRVTPQTHVSSCLMKSGSASGVLGMKRLIYWVGPESAWPGQARTSVSGTTHPAGWTESRGRLG